MGMLNKFIRKIENDDKVEFVAFEYYNSEDFDIEDFPKITSGRANIDSAYKRATYIPIGCGFDIETTRIDEKHSTMFVTQLSFNDVTVICRTWDEVRRILDLAVIRYKPTNKRRLLVWIHNEKYEWSFIKNQFKWNSKEIKVDGEVVGYQPDVFALDSRTVIKATTSDYIEFRDSYVLTRVGLDKLAKNYNLGISKLKGDFDYSLPRHSKTPLTKEELSYCINDVQILARFHNKYIIPTYIKNGIEIPLTSTGIVRNELKRAFKKLDNSTKNKYKRKIQKGIPDLRTYKDLSNYLYRGGYVHANAIRANMLFKGETMGSYDLKSSYPAVMLHEKFVYFFKDEEPEWFYINGFDKHIMKDYGYWGLFKIYDVKATTTYTIESKNKLFDYSEDARFDNGRLISASWIVVYLTEQDVLNYLDFYGCSHPGQWECYEIHVGKKEPLPKFLKDLVLRYFYLKETLPKDSVEYKIVKSQLNSLYGMCVTAIIFDSLYYNPKTGECEKIDGMSEDEEVKYKRAVSKLILSPWFGWYISAYARRNLLYAFAKLDDDALYGDTDSAKIKNLWIHEHVFKDYNDRMQRLNDTMYVGDYDRKIFKDLGKFDFEGKIYRFKTLGCKRYLYTGIEYNKKKNIYELHTTSKVSGMNTEAFIKKCENENLDIYEEFDNGLQLLPSESGRLSSKYEDHPFILPLTDYNGNTIMVSELSCVTLNESPFNLTMTGDYLDLLRTVQDRYNRTGLLYNIWTGEKESEEEECQAISM